LKLKTIILSILASILVTGCDTADCSLNNTVMCYISFYNGDGEAVAFSDTLSIMAHGTDEVLYNRGVKKSSVSIPLSYYNAEDTLIFKIWGEDYETEAQIAVNKSNTEYFESPECPVKMFHNINYAYVFSGRVIDSVVVVKPSVNFQRDENIRIYVH